MLQDQRGWGRAKAVKAKVLHLNILAAKGATK